MGEEGVIYWQQVYFYPQSLVVVSINNSVALRTCTPEFELLRMLIIFLHRSGYKYESCQSPAVASEFVVLHSKNILVCRPWYIWKICLANQKVRMISDQAIWQLNLKPGVGHHLVFTGWMASSRELTFEQKGTTTKVRVWIDW